MIVKVFPDFGRAIIPLPRDRRIEIPAGNLLPPGPMLFLGNKTGTFPEAMLYVDNPGIVRLAGSVCV